MANLDGGGASADCGRTNAHPLTAPQQAGVRNQQNPEGPGQARSLVHVSARWREGRHPCGDVVDDLLRHVARDEVLRWLTRAFTSDEEMV